MGSLKRVGDTARRVPTSVFVLVAVVLMALGGTWWVRAAPPSPSPFSEDAHSPMNSIVVLPLDDGRLITYESGRFVISDASPDVRRACRRAPSQYPALRTVGQDAPPAFARCG